MMPESGLSLVELLVAVLLLAIGALGAVTMQRTAVQSNQAAYSREVAVSLVRQLLEATKNMSDDDPRLASTDGAFATPPSSLSPANPLDLEGETTGRGFTRTWRITNLGPQPDGTPNLKEIDVRVQWEQTNRAEQVQLTTRKSPGALS